MSHPLPVWNFPGRKRVGGQVTARLGQVRMFYHCAGEVKSQLFAAQVQPCGFPGWGQAGPPVRVRLLRPPGSSGICRAPFLCS